MDLGENYFPLLGQYLLEFVVALVLLAGLYFLTRRWTSKELMARAFRWGMLSLIYVSVSAFALDAFMTTIAGGERPLCSAPGWYSFCFPWASCGATTW